MKATPAPMRAAPSLLGRASPPGLASINGPAPLYHPGSSGGGLGAPYYHGELPERPRGVVPEPGYYQRGGVGRRVD